MVADSVLKTEIRNDIAGDNDNHAGAVLTQKEIHPLALEAAKRLINRHTAKTPVVIKSWGTPDVVYEDVRQSLIDFGYEISMAEDMAEKLVDHAVDHAEISRAKYSANIIALKIEVSRAKPLPQFETGALESQRIDGFSQQAQIAGATSVAIGINTGGTTVTALRDSVGEIMQAMAGASQAVWIDFEAPDKSELQGVANDAALSAMAEIAGGSLAPEKVEALLAEIQMLVDAGLLTPEIASVLQNLNQIQAQAIKGNVDGIKELSQSIIEDLSTLLDAGEVSLDIVSQAMEALQSISNAHSLHTVIDIKSMMALSQDIQVAQLVEKLDIIASDLTGADQATIKELIDQLTDLDGSDLISHIDNIQQQLETIGIDPQQLMEIKQDITTLKDTIIQNLPLEQKLEVVSDLGAQDLLNVLQDLNGMDGIPAELSEMIEKLDIENISIEDLTEALAGKGDPAFVELAQNIVLALNSPEVQVKLPQSALNQVNSFLSAQPSLVEAVSAQAIISTISETSVDINLPEAEAIKIQQVVERLEAGESIETIDPAIIEAVAHQTDGAVPPQIEQATTIIQNTIADNVIVGTDAVKLDEGTVLNLEAMTHSEVIEPQVKEEIAAVLQAPNDVNALKAVQESLGNNAPPAIADAISRITMIQSGNNPIITKPEFPTPAVVQSLTLMAQQVSKSGSPAQAELLNASAKIIQKFENTGTKPTIKEVVTAIQKINETIHRNSASGENITPAQQLELLKVKEKLVEALPADIKNDLKPQIEQKFSDTDTSLVQLQDPAKTDDAKFESPCDGCGGGKCPGCGSDFGDAISQAENDSLSNPLMSDIDISEITIDGPTESDDIKFESPCDGCGGGKCPGCGSDFSDAISQAESNDSFGESLMNDNDSENVVNLEDKKSSEKVKTPTPKAPAA